MFVSTSSADALLEAGARDATEEALVVVDTQKHHHLDHRTVDMALRQGQAQAFAAAFEAAFAGALTGAVVSMTVAGVEASAGVSEVVVAVAEAASAFNPTAIPKALHQGHEALEAVASEAVGMVDAAIQALDTKNVLDLMATVAAATKSHSAAEAATETATATTASDHTTVVATKTHASADDIEEVCMVCHMVVYPFMLRLDKCFIPPLSPRVSPTTCRTQPYHHHRPPPEQSR